MVKDYTIEGRRQRFKRGHWRAQTASRQPQPSQARNALGIRPPLQEDETVVMVKAPDPANDPPMLQRIEGFLVAVGVPGLGKFGVYAVQWKMRSSRGQVMEDNTDLKRINKYMSSSIDA